MNKELEPHSQVLISSSAADTERFGEKMGKAIASGTIVALLGDLGAGKTTFVKGLVRGSTGLCATEVSSPTFSYLNEYSGEGREAKPVYHFDLYRLRSANDFFSMGFDEYFTKKGICCIEWPELILPLLSKSSSDLNVIQIVFSYTGETERKLVVYDKKTPLF